MLMMEAADDDLTPESDETQSIKAPDFCAKIFLIRISPRFMILLKSYSLSLFEIRAAISSKQC